MAEDNVPPLTSDHEVADLFVGKLDIPKLQDALLAGKADSESCTLILTEGDSASNFAMSGDKYGVFPLEGKLLNVRDASPQELKQNAELQNIKNILGLRYDKIYEDVDKLRYGHLMIMANKGQDSLHIIGLLINFLHYFWPSLLKVKKHFLRVFITPIIKATDKKTNEVVSLFYTMNEYQKWQKDLGNTVTEYKIKYFEGPETIKSDEERAAYLDQHVKDFVWIDDLDGRAIESAFTKEFEDRQYWLENQMETDTYLDSNNKEIRYLDFINVDFKRYVEADLQRSIPSMIDGLKPCQRKILFYALKKPIIQEIEVDEFCAYMFEHSPYHHGEESLVGTIIGMSQNYVGSNNINLLRPNGHFGTRLMGGKDHDASGRCLSTQLSPITRYLFPKDDDGLILVCLNDEVPAWFYPIIPMVLVNGSEGRGIVCSSFIPNYHPRDIISNIKRLLNGEKMEPMLPWYNGFKGEIEERETPNDTLYTTKGKIEDVKNDSITITELPVGKWTFDYEQSLVEASLDEKDIKDYTARHGDTNNVRFEITMTKDQMIKSIEEGLNKFKLTTTLSTANMHLMLFKENQLVKYNTPEQILQDFFRVRLKLYGQKRIFRIRELERALKILENKVNFILQVCTGKILMFPLKRHFERCDELKKKGFQSLQSIEGREVTKEEELRIGYNYLLSIPVESYSDEKMEELNKEVDEKNFELSELETSSPKDLWLKDLDHLIRKLDAEEYPLPAKRAPDAAGPQRAKRRVVCSE